MHVGAGAPGGFPVGFFADDAFVLLEGGRDVEGGDVAEELELGGVFVVVCAERYRHGDAVVGKAAEKLC